MIRQCFNKNIIIFLLLFSIYGCTSQSDTTVFYKYVPPKQDEIKKFLTYKNISFVAGCGRIFKIIEKWVLDKDPTTNKTFVKLTGYEIVKDCTPEVGISFEYPF